MTKDCFKEKVVDAQKYRECAVCPLYEECTEVVTLKEQRAASFVGQWLGVGVGLLGLFLAATYLPDIPNGAWWLAGISGVYLISVFAAGASYRARNDEESEDLQQKAEALPEV